MNDTLMYQARIVRIPGLVGGKPVIKGTRIPVDMILERLTYDLDLKTLFEDYPDLTEEDIKACLAYAKGPVEEEEMFPTVAPKTHHVHVRNFFLTRILNAVSHRF